MGNIIRFFLSLILVVISMLTNNDTLYFVLIMCAYIISAYPIIIKAIRNIFYGELFDENFLMALATIVALILGEYLEAVAVILFYTLGISFEYFALNKSKKSIKELMDIKPDYANLVGVDLKKVDCEAVEIGDIIRVFPGEKVPLDGIVLKGGALLDTKAITGESNLKEVTADDNILSGSININGVIDVTVTKVFSESTVSKILELVETATNNKSKQENFIRKFAKVYTPIVVFLSIIVSLLIPFIFNLDYSTWIYRGLNFLVVSCPCALVISIPMSFVGGIALCAKTGVLIKGSNFFELIATIDTIVLDKTGTITKGEFFVKDVQTNIEYDEFIKYAIISEYNSLHPIAVMIKNIADIDVNNDLISEYKEEIGYGISLKYNNQLLICGNAKIMKKYQIEIEEQKGTVVYFSLNREFIGTISLEDKVKDNVSNSISNLRKSGINKIIMLSGDNDYTCNEVSKAVGIDKYYSNLLPHEKVDVLKELISESKMVAFVGDGINDAPSLKYVDVGISMGSVGSSAAIEASDVVIIQDDLNKITDIISISKKTLKICMQNIIFAISVKVIILFLATFGLSNLWLAIVGDVGVSILAILNSLRLLYKK